jgi:prepilin-type N-terminal cleavage/methylation domain-containing protein
MNEYIRRFKCRKLDAFTLIELLITLTIIGILAGLLGVFVTKAKAKARDVGCKHNASQFGVALGAFVQERGTYPLQVNHKRGKNDEPSNWIRALFPNPHRSSNTDVEGIFDCPAASRPKQFPNDLSFAEYAYNSVGLLGGPPLMRYSASEVMEVIMTHGEPLSENLMLKHPITCSRLAMHL